MRLALIQLLLIPLVACTAAAPSPAELRARQEAACRSVIAAHVGRPEGEVSVRWVSQADGMAQVQARDGDRVHVCDVDQAARVVNYTHPGA